MVWRFYKKIFLVEIFYFLVSYRSGEVEFMLVKENGEFFIWFVLFLFLNFWGYVYISNGSLFLVELKLGGVYKVVVSWILLDFV